MAKYVFLTQWYLEAPIETIWNELEDCNKWPTWWPLIKTMEQLQPPDAQGLGAKFRVVYRSRLPYELGLTHRVVRKSAPQLLELASTGDLVGLGLWVLVSEADGTVVRYVRTANTSKPWMNALAPIARPAFEWNHDQVMRSGGEGLGQKLGVRFIDQSKHV